MTTSRFRSPFVKTLIPVIGIIIIIIAALSLLKSQVSYDDQAALEVGATVPHFKVTELGKAPVDTSELKAKVLMITFWATWCDACMIEMPTIVQLWERYKDRGFSVMAINADEDPETVVPRVAKRMGMRFPLYTDKDGRIAELLDVHAVPFTILLDESRKILFIENGERDWNSPEIHSRMERWLSKKN